MATVWYTISPQVLTQELQANAHEGLSSVEVQRRLAQHGPNTLPEPIPPSPLVLFLQPVY